MAARRSRSHYALATAFSRLLAAEKQLASARFWVNVKDHGAIGDGVANDGPAIAAAITEAQTVAGGVWFPPGTYGVSSFVSLRSRVSMLGSGMGASTIRALAGVTSGLLVGTSGNLVSDLVIAGLTLDCRWEESALAGIKGVQVTNGARLILELLEIKNSARGGAHFNNSLDCTVDRAWITKTGMDDNAGGHAVSFAQGSHGGKLFDSRISGGGAMCVSIGATSGSAGCAIRGNNLSNIVSTTNLECIGVAVGSDRARVTDNDCVNSHDNGISASADDGTYTGNTISGAVNSGISVIGHHNALRANVCKNAGGVESDTAAGPWGGITLSGTNNAVETNVCYDNRSPKWQDYGILERTGADFNAFSGNVLRGNLLAAKLLVGAGSVATGNVE